MDPEKINRVIDLLVAAVAKKDIKPRKENDTRILYYSQDRKGTCGVSSLSSAFHDMFENNLATRIHSN